MKKRNAIIILIILFCASVAGGYFVTKKIHRDKNKKASNDNVTSATDATETDAASGAAAGTDATSEEATDTDATSEAATETDATSEAATGTDATGIDEALTTEESGNTNDDYGEATTEHFIPEDIMPGIINPEELLPNITTEEILPDIPF